MRGGLGWMVFVGRRVGWMVFWSLGIGAGLFSGRFFWLMLNVMSLVSLAWFHEAR